MAERPMPSVILSAFGGVLFIATGFGPAIVSFALSPGRFTWTSQVFFVLLFVVPGFAVLVCSALLLFAASSRIVWGSLILGISMAVSSVFLATSFLASNPFLAVFVLASEFGVGSVLGAIGGLSSLVWRSGGGKDSGRAEDMVAPHGRAWTLLAFVMSGISVGSGVLVLMWAQKELSVYLYVFSGHVAAHYNGPELVFILSWIAYGLIAIASSVLIPLRPRYSATWGGLLIVVFSAYILGTILSYSWTGVPPGAAVGGLGLLAGAIAMASDPTARGLVKRWLR